MTALRSVFGVVPVLALAALAALAGLLVAAVRWIFGREPFDITDDDDQPDEDLVIDEPLTAPGLNHPAHHPLPKRKTWVDEQGDHHTPRQAIGVAEVIPFAEPECTCEPVTHPDLTAWVDREWEFAGFDADLIAGLYLMPEATS